MNKAFPENPNAQTEQALKTNNSSISSIGMLNQNSLEGFGQKSINGFANKKKQNEFPDLGKTTNYKNESFAPVYKEDTNKYLVEPNHNMVIGEIKGTTSDELEISEQIEEGNSKEKSEETSSELQKEPYLSYEDLLPDETDEEREVREARELEAFNKAWDKANGVEEKEADAVLTGGAAGIEQSDIKKTGKNNLTWQENFLDNYLRNAELIKNSYPISSNMYTDARTDFSVK